MKLVEKKHNTIPNANIVVRCHANACMHRTMQSLQIRFSGIPPANLNEFGQILHAHVDRTHISRVKIRAPWAKGAQNGGEKSGVL